MPWHINAMYIAGSKHEELLLGGKLVRNTVSKGTDVSFSKHLTRQTDSKFHAEKRKGPKSSQNSHHHSVVSRVSLAEWVLSTSAESEGQPEEDVRAGNTTAGLTAECQKIGVRRPKPYPLNQNLTHWTKTSMDL